MPRYAFERILLALAAWALTLNPATAAMAAIAKVAEETQPVSGNGWIALGVIALLIGVVIMLVRGTLFIEERHARMYGPPRDGGHSWFGPIHSDDDGNGSN
jgi:chromate transport protein ChrA